jgi:hypothetical protein
MTPPWLPLLMVVVLLALIGFLYWSMRRNLNRINFEERDPASPVSAPASPVSPTE